MDQWISRSVDQWVGGLVEQWINGVSGSVRQLALADQWISLLVEWRVNYQRIYGSVDQWVSLLNAPTVAVRSSRKPNEFHEGTQGTHILAPLLRGLKRATSQIG